MCWDSSSPSPPSSPTFFTSAAPSCWLPRWEPFSASPPVALPFYTRFAERKSELGLVSGLSGSRQQEALSLELHRHRRFHHRRLTIHAIRLEFPPAQSVHRRPRQHLRTIERVHVLDRSIPPHHNIQRYNSLQIRFAR